jgi:hypothetical protein
MNALRNSTFLSVTLALFLIATVKAGDMKIMSPAFPNGGSIPAKFSHQGGNSNPSLKIEGVPANAKSLVVMVDDPDAPSGLFTHWLVWNIDPKTTAIAERNVPKGSVEGTNDFGESGYGGPQPPSGTHRYFFKIFALDRTLDLSAGAKRREVDKAMKGHVIARAELMARFSAK